MFGIKILSKKQAFQSSIEFWDSYKNSDEIGQHAFPKLARLGAKF
jgi:hypothetical protein